MKQQRIHILLLGLFIAILMFSSAYALSFFVQEDHHLTSNDPQFFLFNEFKTLTLDESQLIEVTNQSATPGIFQLVITSSGEVSINGEALTRFRFDYGGGLYNPLSSSSYVFTSSNLTDSVLLEVTISTPAVISVIPFSTHNAFITHQYDLEYLNNQFFDQTLHTIKDDQPILTLNEVGKAVYRDEFKILYFLDDLLIAEDLIINFPASFNFLHANITLNGQLDIHHGYAGMFYLASLSGKVINDSFAFRITTYNAYYQSNDVTLVSNLSNFSKVIKGEISDVEVVIDDIIAYIKGYLPDLIYADILLPLTYHYLDVVITYHNPLSYILYQDHLKQVIQRGSETIPFDLSFSVTFNGVSKESNKNMQIVGLDEQSLLEAYCHELNNAITNLPYDISNLTSEFVKFNANVQEITISLPEFSQLTLLKNGIETNQSNVFSSQVIISQKAIIAQSNDEIINLSSLNYQTSFTTFVRGLNFTQRNEEIAKYHQPIYLSNEGARPILNVKADQKIYLGDDLQIDAYFPFLEFYHTFIEVSEILYDDYLGGVRSFEELYLASGGVSDVRISIEDGFAFPNISFRLRDGNVFLHALTFKYSDYQDTVTLVNKVVIPPLGVGGHEYEEFLRGDTFAEYFSSLSEGMLIKDKDYLDFTTDRSQLWVKLYLIEANSVGYDPKNTQISNQNNQVYCYIESVFNYFSAHEYIRIDINYLPTYDTYVTLQAVFTLDYDDLDEAKRISVQNYHFIIPGIYRFGSDFDDLFIYARILEVYGHFQGYLLRKDALLAKDLFDARYDTLYDIDVKPLFDWGIINDVGENILLTNYKIRPLPGYRFSLKGVELLFNTSAMDFSGLPLKGLEHFTPNQSLRSLKLNNCQLSDIHLLNGSLANLLKLSHIELSANNLQGTFFTTDWIFRSVTYLDLSKQNNLTSIKNIEHAIPLLNTLKLSGNKIKNFAPLKQLENLQLVEVYDNYIDEIYGTNGKINIPNFVYLYARQVNILVSSSSFLSISTLTLNQIEGHSIDEQTYQYAISLNAISYFCQYETNTIVLPGKLKIYSSNSYLFYPLDLISISFNQVIFDLSYQIHESDYLIDVTPGEIELIIGLEHVYRLLEFEVI